MNWRKGLCWVGAVLGGVLIAALLIALSGWMYFRPAHSRTNGLVYGERGETVLTFDVVRPKRPNGAGVILMVSGSWKSGTNSFRPWLVAPLLRRGYTVFAVYHVPQPRATVMEITADVQRAVRCIRMRASEFGVHPERLGITGGSSGGHLSLWLATRGDDGNPLAPDVVEQHSSRIQAVAVFFPVTDLLNLGTSTENPGDGGPPKSYVKAFGPESTNMATWKVIGRDMSPIYHISTNLPPTLIVHGDADTLVPLDQSSRFRDAAPKAGQEVKLVVRKGGKHGWPSMPVDIARFADWFDAHLREPVVTLKR